MKDLKAYFEEVARGVQWEVYCMEHDKRPSFTVTKTGDKATITWNFCCDKQKQDAERRFKPRIEKAMHAYATETIKESLKGIKGLSFR